MALEAVKPTTADPHPSASVSSVRSAPRSMRNRIMYVENKAGGLVGPARIGRVTFSKRGKTIHYGGLSFQSLHGAGFKANFFCVETGERYWISGPRKDGADGLYGYRPTPIDEDVRVEYWTVIREAPERAHETTT
jgi:hypothetical protein